MSTEKDNARDELLGLRDMTKLFGILHDRQAQHLRVWGRLLADDCTVKVDLDAKQVIYQLQVESKGRNSKKKFAGLAESVRWLLGPWWKVDVIVNDEIRYEFVGTETWNEAKYPKNDFEAAPRTDLLGPGWTLALKGKKP